MSLRLLSLLPLALLAACMSGPPPEPKAPPQRWVESPNGEPLPFAPGQPDCAAALTAWMAQADKNGDGVADMDEMVTDAARWFAIADQDHDGQVTSDELAEVRRRLVPPEPAPQPESPPEAADDGRQGGPPGGGPGQGRARLRSNVRLDPVMQADANADFRVTALEFRTFVIDRMQGRSVSRTDLLRGCDSARR